MINRIVVDSFIGLLTGISMGATGIGAGLLSVPLLIYSGLSFKEAVSVSMLMQLLPQSILGVKNYWDEIQWGVSLRVIISSILGIYIGSYIVTNNIISEIMLYKILTIFLFFSSIYFYFNFWK
uniref:Membrane transporter protein n=1 Tax=viral metagenome TaxID=1070528 RepID=A0A6C0KWE7_9ZZZZ|tara:strand:+ start:4331 stop:4699 length:369 start_codon:yes stop_codon:yes gene_type:complete